MFYFFEVSGPTSPRQKFCCLKRSDQGQCRTQGMVL